MGDLPPVIAGEMDRAFRALRAAELLFRAALFEDCISRSYYAVLHAAKAALGAKRETPGSHRAVIRLFGKALVKEGLIEKEYAKILALEQEDRETGDYDTDVHFTKAQTEQRVKDARRFIDRMARFLDESFR